MNIVDRYSYVRNIDKDGEVKAVSNLINYLETNLLDNYLNKLSQIKEEWELLVKKGFDKNNQIYTWLFKHKNLEIIDKLFSLFVDAIIIHSCPHCNKPHVYSVSVKRACISHSYPGYIYERSKTYTRLLTCPSSDNDFEVKMNFVEYINDPFSELSMSGYLPIQVDIDELKHFIKVFQFDGIQFKENNSSLSFEKTDLPSTGLIYKGIKLLGVF